MGITPKVQMIAWAAKDHVYPWLVLACILTRHYGERGKLLVNLPDASTQMLMNQGSAKAES